MTQFIAWLAATRASALVANTSWIIPAVQCLHIVCVGVVMASVLLLDLRIVAGRGEALAAYTRRYLAWVWIALGLLLVTGTILIVGEPNRDLSNATFWLKMALVVVAAQAEPGPSLRAQCWASQ